MSQPVLLGCNPDTLVLNVLPTDAQFQVVRRRLDESLEQELDSLKQRAQEEEEPIPTRWVFEGGNLFMKEKGGSHFKWILDHPLLSVAISRGVKVAMLGQVRFSSEYLWRECTREDLGVAISKVHVFLTELFGQHFLLQVSALDLAADFVWPDFGQANVKEDFITRATFDDEMPLSSVTADGMIDGPESIKRRWRRITGLPFGKRDAAVSAIIYDKTHEIKYQSPTKRWFHDLWLSKTDEQGMPVWDGKAPVIRVEVRFKRKAIAEGGIEQAYELLDRLAAMWSYAVGHVGGGADGLPDGWLRYVVPSADLNRSRWPVRPEWQVIQTAFQPGTQDALPESGYERTQREREDLLQQVDEELAARPFRFHDRSLLPSISAPAAPEPSPVDAAPTAAPASPFDLGPFIRDRKRQVNFERAFAAFAGWTSTVEAWREGKGETDVEADISDTMHFIYQNVQTYLAEKEKKTKKKKDFAAIVHDKRVLYRLETATFA